MNGKLAGSFAVLSLLLAACGQDAPPSIEGVGETVGLPPPRVREAEVSTLYDADGVPLASGERVAGLELPVGLTELSAPTRRRHIYNSEIDVPHLLRFFGPRLVTMQIEHEGERVTYLDAVPRGARGGVVRLDVSLRPTSASPARLEIRERPPARAETSRVSVDDVRRHFDRVTKNRE